MYVMIAYGLSMHIYTTICIRPYNAHKHMLTTVADQEEVQAQAWNS